MADEILGRLDELKAGQDALQAELLGAVGQSNQAVLGAIQTLSSRLDSMDTRLDSLESEVRFNRSVLTDLQRSTSDHFAELHDFLNVPRKAAR